MSCSDLRSIAISMTHCHCHCPCPAKPRRYTSWLGCIYSWVETCSVTVYRTIIWVLMLQVAIFSAIFVKLLSGEEPNSNRRPVRRSLVPWEIVFVISYVIAVSADPLFFFIPTVNEEEKCLEMDTKLRTVTLILRSFTDIIFICQVFKAIKGADIWLSVVFSKTIWLNFLAILPVPQVLILVILYKKRELGYLNVFLFFQYALRIYRLCQSFNNFKEKENPGSWVKIVFNFFLYILACHILGASWFFFSTQREISCWHQICVKHNTCGNNLKCGNNISRNITKLVEFCPMNPPNSTIFDFGIFVNPLGTTSITPIYFLTKVSYSFWWGLRNISNFGTNLETSTYLLEIWFASLISVIGLILFLYLIGNNVQTYMSMQTVKAEEEAERIKQDHLHQETQINSWMHRNELPDWERTQIKAKMKETWREDKKIKLDNVITLLSLLDSRGLVQRLICIKMLENVPELKDMDRYLLLSISKQMMVVVRPKGALIVETNEPLDRMIFITEGKIGIHTSSTDSSESSSLEIIQGSMEECNIYGRELLSWALSNPKDVNCLPNSKETVKCHTQVEGFVLSADVLTRALGRYGVIHKNDSDKDRAEISNSIERGSSSSLRSRIIAATAASRFHGRVRPALLDSDPSSYEGL